MAENDFNMVFEASTTTVIAMTSALADGGFAVSGNATITEFDNTTNPKPAALATLEAPEAFGSAPGANTSIDLYIFRQDVGTGTNDVTAPTATDKQGAHYIGSFPLYATDEQQNQEIVISLLGIKKAKFSIQNNSGDALSYASAGTAATVKVERLTYRPEPAA